MVTIKSSEEVAIMAEGGRRLAAVLKRLAGEAIPGVATRELDAFARTLIAEHGDIPSFLGYRPQGAVRPYPAALCVSVNDTIVHGLPSDYVIKDGDLVSLDLGLVHKGYHVDAAVTVEAGRVSGDARALVRATRDALDAAVAQARLGNTLGDIGATVEEVARRSGFSVVDMLTGHGIGRELHEPPYVPNKGKRGAGMKLAEGVVIAIEPMVAMGRSTVKQKDDDSFVTDDGSLAAHFEHTVAITREGPRVLTAIL